jgi:hypothetical protein
MAVADASDVDLGTLYIVIYDPEIDETVAAGFINRTAAGYRYRASDIPEGSYQVFAGTDLDNDQLICDSGEACGAYLTIDQPLTITVDGDRDGLDFPVEYLIALPGSASQAHNVNPRSFPCCCLPAGIAHRLTRMRRPRAPRARSPCSLRTRRGRRTPELRPKQIRRQTREQTCCSAAPCR